MFLYPIESWHVLKCVQHPLETTEFLGGTVSVPDIGMSFSLYCLRAIPNSWTSASPSTAIPKIHVFFFFFVDFQFLFVLRYHGRLDMVTELLAAGASKAGRPRFACQHVFGRLRMNWVVHYSTFTFTFCVHIGGDLS